MNTDKLKPNELKLLIYLLNQLEKRLYILRLALYGEAKNYFPDGSLVSKENLDLEKNDFGTSSNIADDYYRLLVDSCEVEAYVHRILHEMANKKTFESLKDVIVELEEKSVAFTKLQETLENKRKQIEESKVVLHALQEQARVTAQGLEDEEKAREEEAVLEASDEIEFLKKLMAHKIESRKDYYQHKQAELQENIEWYERETRSQEHADVQTLSFWLLKYDNFSEKLDLFLKQMFDSWSEKRRNLGILKKYRKLNLERIQRLRELISEREDYIEKDRVGKERERKKMEEQLREQAAAVIIQAFWRGTMVRRRLGPYKVKKPKKGKGKKGKGKKEKGKKGSGKKKKK